MMAQNKFLFRLFSNSPKGQILVELLIVITVIGVLVGLGAQLSSVSLNAVKASRERGTAVRLAQEAIEAIRAIAYSNDSQSQGWNKIYKPPDGSGNESTSKGSANPYYPVISTSTSQWILFTGQGTIVLEGETYARKVIIDNVSRDANANIESTYNPSNDDPATQKIQVIVSKTNAPDTVVIEYFTRFFNESSPQSDWSGGANCGPFSATSTVTNYCTQTCITNPSGNFSLLSGC